MTDDKPQAQIDRETHGLQPGSVWRHYRGGVDPLGMGV